MDKKIIFAVAGSGKTAHIINKLNVTSRTADHVAVRL